MIALYFLRVVESIDIRQERSLASICLIIRLKFVFRTECLVGSVFSLSAEEPGLYFVEPLGLTD